MTPKRRSPRAPARSARGVLAIAAIAFAAIASGAPSALADEPPLTVEQLATRAYELHAAGKYAESIATYLKAYEIGKVSETLFNVASIYDHKLHEPELAEEYYRRYIVAADAGPNLVKRATERLAALKKEADEQAAREAAARAAAAPPAAVPAPAPIAPPPPEAAPPSAGGHRFRTIGIVLGGVGLAGVAASLALGLAAKNDNADANQLCNGAVCRTQQGVNDAQTAGTFATASTVTFVAGLAVLAGGVTLFFVPSASRQAGSLSVSPRLARDGAGVGLSGAF